jgi:hypothetical protein
MKVAAGILFAAILANGHAFAQAAEAPAPEPTRPPEGSRIINLPSTEVPAAGTLGVLFIHRFKTPLGDSNARNLFSLDNGADDDFGVSFSPLNSLELSLDRSSIEADWELAAKYRFFRIERGRPFALALRVGGDAVTKEIGPRAGRPAGVENRKGFFAQGIASLAIGPRIRLTASPTYVSNTALFRNVFNVPAALSFAITPTVNVHGELYPKNRDFTKTPARPSGTHVGWIASIEKTVLRHRFAFTVGNLRATNVDQYTGSDLGGAGVPSHMFLGFNIVRQWKLK